VSASANMPREDKASFQQPGKSPGKKGWMLVALLFLFILPLLGGTYWMYVQSEREIKTEELQNDLLHARTLSEIVEQDFTTAEESLTSIADRSDVRRDWERRDMAAMDKHLREARKLEPAFLFTGVLERDGTMRVIVPPDKIVGWNFAYRDWYRGVTAHWEPYVSEVYQTAASPNPLVVAVAVPIRGNDGQPTGILMATYSLAQLSNKFRMLDKGSKADFYIVDQHGMVAVSSREDGRSAAVHAPAAPAAKSALEGAEGSGRFEVDGKNAFAGYAPVPQLGWGVLYVRSEEEALAPAMHLKNQHRLVSLYLLLIYLATAAFAAIVMRRKTQLLAANQALNADLQKQIAETKKAREELDRYFLLALDMFCIAGADGYFKRLNPAWEKTLGFTVEELLAKPYLDFIHPDDREATAGQAEKQSRGEEVLSFANRYRCKDGSYKWLSWSATPVIDQGLIYAVARDITELKKMQDALTQAKEEAERSNKFKDQFLSTMSHELRTPLNAVLGFSDLLTEEHYGPLNERQKRYLDHIQKGGKHLLRLINDILDLSRIEAGRLQISVERVAVKTSFADAVDNMRPLADKRLHTLEAFAPPELNVRADPTRFRQVLMNLMGNAIKFTPEGGKIELRAQELGEVVRIEVRDSGPGIPTEDQHRIFEAFYRLRRNEKTTEGTGLGLAITRSLVELHGGHLGIESEPGAGSCFFFTLPMERAHPIRGDQGGSFRAISGDHQRILVVEDDSKSAQLLESQLTSAGYEVTVCKQPERALGLAAELKPSVITLDIIMKPISGWELLPKLKSDPRTSGIPVILVTIVDQPETGALLGAEEYIVKPVLKANLLAAVQRCLNRRGKTSQSGRVLVVEDDAATREFIAEFLTSHGYAVGTAADGLEARAQVASSLPTLVILDLILPEVSGFHLLAEWRNDLRTANLCVLVLTSKDLTREEREYLQANAGALLRKQEMWQEALLEHIQRALPQVPAGRS